MDLADQTGNSMGIPLLANNSEIMAAAGVVGILILMVMHFVL